MKFSMCSKAQRDRPKTVVTCLLLLSFLFTTFSCYLQRQAKANSVDPEQTPQNVRPIKMYTLCYSLLLI